MKRSEMLDYLETHLSELGIQSSPRKLAELVLFLVENKNMLPPWNPIGSEPLEGHVMYCQWDPE